MLCGVVGSVGNDGVSEGRFPTDLHVRSISVAVPVPE